MNLKKIFSSILQKTKLKLPIVPGFIEDVLEVLNTNEVEEFCFTVVLFVFVTYWVAFYLKVRIKKIGMRSIFVKELIKT